MFPHNCCSVDRCCCETIAEYLVGVIDGPSKYLDLVLRIDLCPWMGRCQTGEIYFNYVAFRSLVSYGMAYLNNFDSSTLLVRTLLPMAPWLSAFLMPC